VLQVQEYIKAIYQLAKFELKQRSWELLQLCCTGGGHLHQLRQSAIAFVMIKSVTENVPEPG
jgi:hypothetical protein